MRYTGLFFAILFLVAGCNKAELDHTLSSQPVYKNYYPVAVGKEMVYQLDSIVPAPFGVRLLTHTYYIKDIVSKITLEGKDTVYQINRYIAEQADATQWNYHYSYNARLKTNTLEVTEKEKVSQQEPIPISGLTELKFIKLSNPLNENTKWNGNRYFTKGNEGSASYLYKYNDWEYVYKNTGQPKETIYDTYANTITVLGTDQLYGDTNETPTQYQQKIYSEEVYAYGVGLVYKYFIYTDFQPANSTSPGYQARSFGIRLQLVHSK